MQRLALVPILALTASPLVAQADHYTPSPAGYESTEGSYHEHLIGAEPRLRYQQVDATNLGGKSNRNRMAFRRDGLLGVNNEWGSRTLELEVTWGDGNLQSFGPDFDANFTTTNKTVVFS